MCQKLANSLECVEDRQQLTKKKATSKYHSLKAYKVGPALPGSPVGLAWIGSQARNSFVYVRIFIPMYNPEDLLLATFYLELSGFAAYWGCPPWNRGRQVSLR